MKRGEYLPGSSAKKRYRVHKSKQQLQIKHRHAYSQKMYLMGEWAQKMPKKSVLINGTRNFDPHYFSVGGYITRNITLSEKKKMCSSVEVHIFTTHLT